MNKFEAVFLMVLFAFFFAFTWWAFVTGQDEEYESYELRCLAVRYASESCESFVRALHPTDPIRKRAEALGVSTNINKN